MEYAHGHCTSTLQTNGKDCGIFAAAYTMDLISDDGIPGLLAPFDIVSMHAHLECC